MVSTNYLRHLHPDPDGLLDEPDPRGLFGRHLTLLERFGEQGSFTLDEVRSNAQCVSALARVEAGFAPGRTLWHAFYFPAARRMEIDFYLGESATGPRRSPPHSFTLETDASR